jgi:hypothetical protein
MVSPNYKYLRKLNYFLDEKHLFQMKRIFLRLSVNFF